MAKALRLSGALLVFSIAALPAARGDTTITITTNGAACQVPPPAEVAAPATPSVPAGIQAARNRNFALARADFQPLADKGDVEAERALGQLLMQNCTGLQEKEAGATWLSKAADGGDSMAQAELGADYMNGQGVAQDDNKAFALLGKAAAAGIPQAQTSLGYLYLTGRGVATDRYQAMVWSVKAGEQGAPIALLNIAQSYLKGTALPQNNDKAAYYIAVAMERAAGQQRNSVTLAVNDISHKLSADDFKYAQERAKRWSPGQGSLSDVLDDAKRRARDGG